jgi:hypothetical protein
MLMFYADAHLYSSCGAASTTLKYAFCCSERLRAVQGDAVDYVARLAAQSPGAVDLAIIDVFDGMDVTPPAVSSPGADVSLTSCQVIRACTCSWSVGSLQDTICWLCTIKQEAPAGGLPGNGAPVAGQGCSTQERDHVILCGPPPAFLKDLAAALHPDHGTAVINLHGGGPGAATGLGRLLGRGQAGPGFRTDNPAGAAVETISQAYRCACRCYG